MFALHTPWSAWLQTTLLEAKQHLSVYLLAGLAQEGAGPQQACAGGSLQRSCYPCGAVHSRPACFTAPGQSAMSCDVLYWAAAASNGVCI